MWRPQPRLLNFNAVTAIACAMCAMVCAQAPEAAKTTAAPAVVPAAEPVAPRPAPAVPTPSATAPAAPAPVQTPVVAKPKLSPLAPAPDWKQLGLFSRIMSREEFEAVTGAVYLSAPDAPHPWTTGAEGVSVETGRPGAPVQVLFREPASSEKNAPRFWRGMRELEPLKPDEPVLKGLQVALDPGHIAGSYAHMEERWLSMSPGTEVMEGALVLQVAQVIKPRLEALGARVSLVRPYNAPVTTAQPENYKDEAREVLKEAGVTNPPESYAGLTGDARIPTVQYQAEKLFYRVSEIRARAKKVNEEIKPDLVICLHLNAEGWGDPAHPSFVSGNHFHLLVNGCYAGDELAQEDVRADMLRRVFTRTHEEEARLAGPFAKAVSESTGLPPYVYSTKNARRISDNPYVYARNLLANRLYECPVIYLEPYVMNHEETYKRLLLGHFVGRTLLDGKLVTSPLEDYARGVVKALVEYGRQERRRAP